MPIDTLFGNRMDIEVSAELTNTHDPTSGAEVTNRLLIQDMVRVMTYAVDELAEEDARHRKALLESEGEPVPPPPEPPQPERPAPT